MPRGEGSLLHQQVVIVLGLLTGFMMTALVLILGSPAAFHTAIGPVSGEDYFELLSTYVGVVGAVSVVGILAMTEIGTGFASVGSRLDQFGYTCFLFTLYGFTGALTLILAPFTRWGAVIVLGTTIFLFLAYVAFGGFGRSARKAASP